MADKQSEDERLEEDSAEENVSEYDAATDVALVRGRAVKLLARREHAVVELVEKLVGKGFDRDTVRNVVDELAADDLQSESRFAEALVADRARRGNGPNRVRADLSSAGCEKEAGEQALAEAEVDWAALAAEARSKRFGAASPGEMKERARQTRFLQRRGFDGDAVRAAFND